MFWVPFSHNDLVRTRRFCIHLLDMLSQVTLLVLMTKDYSYSLRKGLNIDFHPALILLNAGILSRMHFRHIVNVGRKKEGVRVHALKDWKNDFFLFIIYIRIDNFTKHPHLYQQPPVVQSSHWKRKWRNYTVIMSLLLPIKQRITLSLFENDTTWRFWKGNYILRVHMYLLSWRKTNFLCIISILSLKSMSKLINVNCLHFIGCQNYTHVLINRVLDQIQITALLPYFLSILHLLLQLSKIM